MRGGPEVQNKSGLCVSRNNDVPARSSWLWFDLKNDVQMGKEVDRVPRRSGCIDGCGTHMKTPSAVEEGYKLVAGEGGTYLHLTARGCSQRRPAAVEAVRQQCAGRLPSGFPPYGL